MALNDNLELLPYIICNIHSVLYTIFLHESQKNYSSSVGKTNKTDIKVTYIRNIEWIRE